jgi:AAA15 family ATPase/GTPase
MRRISALYRTLEATMLIELYGQNFGCFRDEFRLSMLATDIDLDSDRGIVEVKVEGDDEPLRLLRAVAIYGPNGSGKSTVLNAAKSLGLLISSTGKPKRNSSRYNYWFEIYR